MRRALPWIVAALFAAAFVASFSELQRMRTRFGDVTKHAYHDHKDVREFMIRAALDGTTNPIVVIGDSIAEMAQFPSHVSGIAVVNAGIGGMQIVEFARLAPRLLESRRPSLIVVALGANDIGSRSVEADYTKLLTALKPLSPKIISASVTVDSAVNEQATAAASRAGIRYVHLPTVSLIDGVHFDAAGLRTWASTLEAEMKQALRPQHSMLLRELPAQ